MVLAQQREAPESDQRRPRAQGTLKTPSGKARSASERPSGRNLNIQETHQLSKSTSPRGIQDSDDQSLLANDSRSNLLLRALRVRVDCRDFLDILRQGTSWILLPPNIILSEFDIHPELVAAHLMHCGITPNDETLLPDGAREFTTQGGQKGTIDFQKKVILVFHGGNELVNQFSVISHNPRRIDHQRTMRFEIIQHGRVSLEGSIYPVILIDDVVTRPYLETTSRYEPRTLSRYLEELPLLKRKRFEIKVEKAIRSLRREISDSLGTEELKASLSKNVKRITSHVLGGSFFTLPAEATKNEILVLRQDLREMMMKPLYQLIFSYQGGLENDKAFLNRVQQLDWIQHDHLELPDSLETYPEFEKASSNFALLHKAVCPNAKLQLLLAACKTLYNILSRLDVKDGGADQFLPAMIYLIIKINPPHLPSNLLYMENFCSAKAELCGEAAYYFTNVSSCVSFIMKLRGEDLRIDPEEFDRKMTQKQELPHIKALSFVHHSISDLQVNDIEPLLREYQNLASWFISSLETDSVQVHTPETRHWGRLKVRAAESNFFSLVPPPPQGQALTLQWLQTAVCSKLNRPTQNLRSIVWLPDILLSSRSDCEILSDSLSCQQEVCLEVMFKQEEEEERKGIAQ